MAYIYCITNQINHKKYIGKTTNSVQERFKQHCRDSKKVRCNKRPLYSAMNKYGIECFTIEELEEIENITLLSEREVFWIEKFQTYGKHGYNATKGGDGKILHSYSKIIELYSFGYTCKQVSEKLHCDESLVRKVLKANHMKARAGSTKRIDQFDLNGTFIQYFWGGREAAKWLVEQGLAKSINSKRHIIDCCNNKCPHAYHYIWKYGEIPSL